MKATGGNENHFCPHKIVAGPASCWTVVKTSSFASILLGKEFVSTSNGFESCKAESCQSVLRVIPRSLFEGDPIQVKLHWSTLPRQRKKESRLDSLQIFIF